MTEALGVAQSALTKVLRRLIDGGALLEARTHVSGEPRRLKVYQLTSHGEAIARDLRRRSGAGGGGATGPPRPPATGRAAGEPRAEGVSTGVGARGATRGSAET
ncbi:MAG: hypothetical protein L3K17_05610 [Thermoplasmata archaeon]|nr:hypothetical protein [Thermoplasmata archaeon]